MSDDKDKEIAALKARLEALERPSAPIEGAVPHAPKSGNNSVLKGGYILAGLLVLGFVWFFFSNPKTDSPPVTVNGFDSPTQAAIAADAAAVRAQRSQGAEAGTSWAYLDNADPMTDRLTSTACTTSTNQVRLDAPYEDVAAELCIRQSPKWGLDVFVQLRGDGQILCRPFRDCAVKVRFGEGAQQSFSAADSADGSSNIIFLTNASRFVTGVKAADLTRIELTLYQAGNQIVEFNTKGLEWPRPAPAAAAE